MLLVFTSEELERIIEKYSSKSVKIEFLGDNRLKLKKSGMSISLFLNDVKPRKLSFIYKMGSIVNFLVDKFLSFEKSGIIWNKETKQIDIDLDQLIQDEKLNGFYIRQLILDTEKMILDFDLKENGEVLKV
ncbi:hypothetical protein [Algoriphagus sp.]|uniref:hypothetical protein n=1 Tax=Algoriphagus sp. TaxID=1872435 RepID=UPI0025E62369|nr:hypothetical protein [Algoriphagus sp.]